MTPLITQAFENQPVRVYGTPDHPLFVAADVCRILDISNPSDALKSLEADERLTLANPEGQTGHGGAQYLNVVTESGLFALIFKSRKPEAKAFRKWVTQEVLPAIRKSGTYQIKELSRREILELALEAEKKAETLALENASLKPKAEAYEAVMASGDSLEFVQVAKLLGIGRNTLMKALREAKILRPNNTPYQDYMDRGYFKVVESSWTDRKTGDKHLTLTTRVFQAGVDYMLRKFSRLGGNTMEEAA